MDITLMDLWLPILVAAVACFLASSVMWMVLPHHKPDLKTLPDEDAFNAATSGLGIAPGLYMFPNCEEGESPSSESMKKRWNEGPWGTINIIGAKPNFAKNMAVNFTEGLLIIAIVAYLASMTMSMGANSSDIVRFTFTGAFLGFVLGGFTGGVFLGTPARFLITSAIDAIVYSALTAAAFYFLWPEAAAATGLPTP